MSSIASSCRSRAGRLPLLAIVFALIVAPACSQTEVRPPESDQHLRLAGSVFGLQTLDPALVRDVDSAFLARQIFRGLMKLDATLQPVPELAASVEISEDGLTYRFRLHEGLTFHNGSSIDADAVVASFNRASDPALAEGNGHDLPAAPYFDDIVGAEERFEGTAATISGIQALDDLTVEFALIRPSASFLMKLTGSPAAIVDSSESGSSDWWAGRNGSGPFMVSEYSEADRLELAAFEDYAGGEPRLKRISIRLGTSANQPFNLYEGEQIDFASVPGWAVDRVQSPGSSLHEQLVVTDLLSTTYIAFNLNQAPFDDPDVRRMIAAGFDVERLVEIALDGRVTMAAGMVPPGIESQTWSSTTMPFDIAAAEGFRNESDLEVAPVIVEAGGWIGGVASAVLGRDLGISLIALDQSWPEFVDRLGQRDMPAFVLTWVADFPAPENMLTALLRTGSADNYSGYSNPEFDRLVDRAAIEADPDLRADLFLRAQQVALDDVAVIPLYHGMSYTLVQPWVRGLTITEIGILGLEDVWIESEPS